ncbi:hypothetical protein B0T26DRAFT_805967 [Lasiosphaeria miniovina]|uniref:DUF676 domain-containing protein n=1 Tax=Lasiosphaeria miniovina TaxID=1954250 RepID=A0AA40DK41_9PEZI|nr:uncharacterized protein B0T26DRAFT_805967 [Lasiosphaeria miniovina]KAK0706100.1 hypothetical protein B0T26DRAFT_805967 [Lasiosphaeria miniovina]
MVMNLVYPGDSLVTVDLVLVHDLSGDVTASWESPTSNVVWPKHLLPLSQEVRQESFRVLSFEYNGNTAVAGNAAPAGGNTVDENASDLLSELGSQRRGQPADRPIIFVAHGYGGLIVKATLSRSRELATSNINQAAIGVVFLATPYNGSHIGNWQDVETPSTGLAPKTYSAQIAADLNLGSSTVSRLAREFTNIANDGLQIVSFAESLPSRCISGGTKFLVSATNTRINHFNETTRSFAAKHYDMTFADNMNDPRFLSLAGEIGRILKTYRDAHQLLSSTKGINDPEALRERENWKVLRSYQGYK